MLAALRQRLPGIGVCLLAAAVAVLVARANPDAIVRLDMAVFDHLQAHVSPPPPERKVVAVLASEQSMIAVRQWPWPRSVHAALLDRLRLADTVAIDILMSEPSDPNEDRAFVDAVERNGNVVQGMHLVQTGEGVHRLAIPFRELAMSIAGAGITNIPPESDGIYRDAFLCWAIGDAIVASFPTAAWMASGHDLPPFERRGGHIVATLPSGEARLGGDFSFKLHHPAEEIPVYEYIDVLNGKHSEEVFRDAIVFIGVNAAGAADYFPIGRGKVLAGVLYNAHAVLTLMHGWIPVAVPDWATAAAAALMAALGTAIGWGRSMRRGWLWAALAALLWVGASVASFFLAMTWLPPVLPLACLLAGFFGASAAQLRFLSGEWNVSHLSIESLLSLGGELRESGATTFPEYLDSRWPSVEKWSGIELVEPYADDASDNVRFVLAEAASHEKDSVNSRITVISSRRGNRMLLRLPDGGRGEARYSVLGWKGKRSGETLKSVGALVLSAATHFKALEESKARRELFLSVIRLIMGAVDAKDPTTAGHSERVAELSRELAEASGLSAQEVDDIYLAGLLHDVGKIGVPDSILNFPGRLSDADMEVMRRHPGIGADIMERIELSKTIRDGIVEHHERLDGKGYPAGLGEGELSLAGRILKIADVYDALISKRQYKDPMPKDLVYKILMEGAGREFDAAYLDLFLSRYFPEYV